MGGGGGVWGGGQRRQREVLGENKLSVVGKFCVIASYNLKDNFNILFLPK